ncbi:hypothetical protein CPAR01_00659 [Colletotrichum paranaense]|uniref:Uncharacterized protein n=1 Tax=Colletotrichum paranaense TaxID=1914294 RepID=A0ABQ9T4I0_9PEZI|nr:uncharacterized protein CPAR01_00659 [Colletotrichum paranaense]KAK1546692.1 hypothetical protein CPAR01_00659 [Colletotrichum paranaense]
MEEKESRGPARKGNRRLRCNCNSSCRRGRGQLQQSTFASCSAPASFSCLRPCLLPSVEALPYTVRTQVLLRCAEASAILVLVLVLISGSPATSTATSTETLPVHLSSVCSSSPYILATLLPLVHPPPPPPPSCIATKTKHAYGYRALQGQGTDLLLRASQPHKAHTLPGSIKPTHPPERTLHRSPPSPTALHSTVHRDEAQVYTQSTGTDTYLAACFWNPGPFEVDPVLLPPRRRYHLPSTNLHLAWTWSRQSSRLTSPHLTSNRQSTDCCLPPSYSPTSPLDFSHVHNTSTITCIAILSSPIQRVPISVPAITESQCPSPDAYYSLCAAGTPRLNPPRR